MDGTYLDDTLLASSPFMLKEFKKLDVKFEQDNMVSSVALTIDSSTLDADSSISIHISID